MAKQRHTYVNFVGEPAPRMLNVSGVALATGADTETVMWRMGGDPFEMYYRAANTDIVFTPVATGWTIPNDNTDNEGIEITQGIVAATTTNLMAATVGTDSMFVKCYFTIPDVSDYDICCVGLRSAEAYQAVANIDTPAELITRYTDVAYLNSNAGNIISNTRLASGVGVQTDTTDNWADGASHTFEVRMTTAGVVTFLIDGAAPTVNTNTLTLTAALVVIPSILITKGAAVADTPPILRSYECGINVSPT